MNIYIMHKADLVDGDNGPINNLKNNLVKGMNSFQWCSTPLKPLHVKYMVDWSSSPVLRKLSGKGINEDPSVHWEICSSESEDANLRSVGGTETEQLKVSNKLKQKKIDKPILKNQTTKERSANGDEVALLSKKLLGSLKNNKSATEKTKPQRKKTRSKKDVDTGSSKDTAFDDYTVCPQQKSVPSILLKNSSPEEQADAINSLKHASFMNICSKRKISFQTIEDEQRNNQELITNSNYMNTNISKSSASKSILKTSMCQRTCLDTNSEPRYSKRHRRAPIEFWKSNPEDFLIFEEKLHSNTSSTLKTKNNKVSVTNKMKKVPIARSYSKLTSENKLEVIPSGNKIDKKVSILKKNKNSIRLAPPGTSVKVKFSKFDEAVFEANEVSLVGTKNPVLQANAISVFELESGYIKLPPLSETNDLSSFDCNKFYTVLENRVQLNIDGVIKEIDVFGQFHILRGVAHKFKNQTTSDSLLQYIILH